MIKQLIAVFFAAFLGTGAVVCYAKPLPEGTDALSRGEWKTYCTGRYLIDLPDALDPEYVFRNDRLAGTDLVWETEFASRKEVLAHVAQMKFNVQNLREARDPYYKDFPRKDGPPYLLRPKNEPYYELLPRKDGSSYFVKQVDYPRGGVGLVVRENNAVNPNNSNIVYNYFFTEKPFRVFSQKFEPIFDSKLQDLLDYSRDLAQALQPREIHEIPKGPGICVYGGFVPDVRGWGEQTGIKLNYPYYSSEYALQIGIGNLTVGQPMTVHPKDRFFSAPKLIKTFRDTSNRTVAGLKGTEYAVQRRNEFDKEIPLYDFTWYYPGTGGSGSSKDPHVAVFMGPISRGIGVNDARVVPRYEAFGNAQEALALWDKVLNGIRRRPE